MSNIDKRALREVAEKATPGNWHRASSRFNGITVTPFSLCDEEVMLAHAVEKRDAEFIAAANPATMLALLDENLQLQREKDAIEAVALALRDDMRQAREQLEAAEKRNAELERSETQLIDERDNAESALNYAYKAVMGQSPEWSNWFSFENAIDEIELVCELWRNQTDDVIQFRQRIAELEAKLETADKLQDSAFRDGLKAGFSYGQTDDQSGFAQCMSAYSNAGIGVKHQEDSVDSDVSSRNQPGMVVAVHIDAGDFVKFKGQVFEVEETDFDDHDVTLWFVGGNTLKCAACCQVEVVSAPVAAGIKVKGE
ncbi:ead/Ea22-like family protein [Salmonella enterica]|nr:ead/Ea22-like family protein [Salmonella enterica]EEM9539856.1 ead/Ea22-like family protein [Salmonella enterica]EEN0873571.1 ead/Ea22-like family protein [Salmonella enterica]EEN1611124.1 ead/Ea22-like family protein [Salmonella enterica]EFS7077553.1 ead/Ea22-like family protein [Salmonella enterica]